MKRSIATLEESIPLFEKRKRMQTNFFRDEQDIPTKTSTSDKRVSSDSIVIHSIMQSIPKRLASGELQFPDFPQFTPNLTPKEVLQKGSFGGTYFRKIYSSVTKETYTDVWKEFPPDWFEGLSIKTQVASSNYNSSLNKYGVSCGGDLKMWEESGWITSIDPYGWFQWYCRFYLGRRCSDDSRQVSRALGVMGATGRWRRNLVNKCLSSGQPLATAKDNAKISPKIRQLLQVQHYLFSFVVTKVISLVTYSWKIDFQHWGYELTLKDLQATVKK
jgi:hypothetical protein